MTRGRRGGPLVLPVCVSCSLKGETVDRQKTALARLTKGQARALPRDGTQVLPGASHAAAATRQRWGQRLGGAGTRQQPYGCTRGAARRVGPSVWRAPLSLLPESHRARRHHLLSCPACPLRTGRWHHSTASLCRLCAGHIPRSGVARFKDSARVQRHRKQRCRPLQLNRQTVLPTEACVLLCTCHRSAPSAILWCTPESRVVSSALLVTNEAECFFHVYGHLNGIFLNRRLRSLTLSAGQAPSKCCRSLGFQRQAEPRMNVLQVTSATVASRHPYRLLMSNKS